MRAKTRSSQRPRTQRGQAMVETALILMLLLGMILFIMDMGRVLLMEQFVTERAREGARYAVVNNWDSTAVANYVVYGSSTAPNGGGPGFLGLTTSEVNFSTIADTGIGDGRDQVTVSGVHFPIFIPFIAGTYTAPTITVTAPAESGGATN
jgi:Flp pilus assembly protein TadG